MSGRRAAIRAPRRADAAVLLGYAVVAFVFLALPLLLTRGNRYLGNGPDARLFIWSFAWWPHAVAHADNPFYTHALWFPSGVNLTWMTTVPALALLFSPVTLLAGPIASYDVAAVVAPALAAWTAFLLCRHLTGRFWVSVLGGYLFGFSSYVLGETGSGHLNLAFVFAVPLIALVVLRFVDGEIRARRLVWQLGLLLALELLISTEVMFTVTLAVGVVAILAFALIPERRSRLRLAALPVACAYAAAALVTSPFLYYLLTGFHRGGFWAIPQGADLLNLVVPPSFDLFGAGWNSALSRGFPSLVAGQESFLGLPAIGVLAACAWRRRGAELLLAAGAAVAALVMLGPHIRAYGDSIVTSPWRVVQGIPVFDNVIPFRFAAYLALAAAVAVASWVAHNPRAPLRIAVAVMAVVVILPDPAAAGWTTGYSIPAFFTDSAYRACLDSGETLMPLPMSYATPLLWQAVDSFRFNLAGGDIAAAGIPTAYESDGIGYITDGNHLGAAQTKLVRTFVSEMHVTTAAVAGYEAGFFTGALNPLATPENAGGVVLYHFADAPPSCADIG